MNASELKALAVGGTLGYDSPYKVRADGRPMYSCQVGIITGITWKYIRVEWIAYASDIGQGIDTENMPAKAISRLQDSPNIFSLD